MGNYDTESWLSYGPTVGNLLTPTDLANMGIRFWQTNGSPTLKWVAGHFAGTVGMQVNSSNPKALYKSQVPVPYVRSGGTPLSNVGLHVLLAQVAQTFAYSDPGGANDSLFTDASGHLGLSLAGGAHVFTSTTNICDGLWHYIDWSYNNGFFPARVNLAVDGADLFGAVTQTGSNNVAYPIGLCSNGTNPATFADLWWAPGGVGRVRVECLVPTADGSHSAWTPSAAGPHYAMVDQRPQDALATYVADDTVGDTDTYDIASLVSTTGTPQIANVVIIGDRGSVVGRSVGTAIVSSVYGGLYLAGTATNDGTSSTSQGLNQGNNTTFNPTCIQGAYTGLTIAQINAMQIGQQVTA